jgi:exosortase
MIAALSPPVVARRAREAPAGLWAAVALVVAVIASYAQSVWDLMQTWMSESSYTHGFVVAPIAAFILWQRRDGLKEVPIRPSLVGWLALIGLMAYRAYLYDRNEQWTEEATIPLVAASLVLAMGGWRLLRWAAPGLAFLLFLLPLPPRINALMAMPLQMMATIASTAMLQATGLPVLSEGNVIYVGTQPLEVARACNGLSMLLSFVTLITATTILVRDRPIWERAFLLISTVPIALIANILRIVATAWVYHLFGVKWGDKIGHDAAGWLMMPIALALVWLELKILSWLIIEENPDDKPFFLPPTSTPRVVKK